MNRRERDMGHRRRPTTPPMPTAPTTPTTTWAHADTEDVLFIAPAETEFRFENYAVTASSAMLFVLMVLGHIHIVRHPFGSVPPPPPPPSPAMSARQPQLLRFPPVPIPLRGEGGEDVLVDVLFGTDGHVRQIRQTDFRPPRPLALHRMPLTQVQRIEQWYLVATEYDRTLRCMETGTLELAAASMVRTVVFLDVFLWGLGLMPEAAYKDAISSGGPILVPRAVITWPGKLAFWTHFCRMACALFADHSTRVHEYNTAFGRYRDARRTRLLCGRNARHRASSAIAAAAARSHANHRSGHNRYARNAAAGYAADSDDGYASEDDLVTAHDRAHTAAFNRCIRAARVPPPPPDVISTLTLVRLQMAMKVINRRLYGKCPDNLPDLPPRRLFQQLASTTLFQIDNLSDRPPTTTRNLF